MYDEFKIRDIELLKIAQNARDFGLEFGQNMELLNILFRQRKIDIDMQNLQKISDIFLGLESIKEKFQLSK
ncbi:MULTISPECIES: hypothetical protein [Campylobacter]|uniref:hypothetical protein n=1 Tax=Campylobacter TaxID=194 RepID=UPI000A34B49E|nr:MULTISPECIES: hypothetical protein [unclassified Campylobacter]MBE6429697.1 acetyltransferase [Campylobacter sp.]